MGKAGEGTVEENGQEDAWENKIFDAGERGGGVGKGKTENNDKRNGKKCEAAKNGRKKKGREIKKKKEETENKYMNKSMENGSKEFQKFPPVFISSHVKHTGNRAVNFRQT